MKIYLAGPYSHKDESVRTERFNALNRHAAMLMNHGYIVFSPISHSHPVAQHLDTRLLMDTEFWMNQDISFIDWCDEVFVLKLQGWRESKGVAHEIEYARKIGRPMRYVEP